MEHKFKVGDEVEVLRINPFNDKETWKPGIIRTLIPYESGEPKYIIDGGTYTLWHDVPESYLKLQRTEKMNSTLIKQLLEVEEKGKIEIARVMSYGINDFGVLVDGLLDTDIHPCKTSEECLKLAKETYGDEYEYVILDDKE